MAVKVKSTKNVALDGVKVLVYGEAGAGKTRLNATIKDNIVLSAEAGLLSLKDHDVPYIEISSIEDLREACRWIAESDEAKVFSTVSLDSISEIAELVLHDEINEVGPEGKKVHGKQAYGETGNKVTKLIRAFKYLKGKNIYFSSKLEKTQDDEGRVMYAPSMPGRRLTQNLPYFFDEVFALRFSRSDDGVDKRALLTQPDGLWSAKDRSGKLDKWMPADLGRVFDVIRGVDTSKEGRESGTGKKKEDRG